MLKLNDFVYIISDYKIDGLEIKMNKVGIVESVNDTFISVDFIDLNKKVEIPIELIKVFKPEETGDGFESKVCNVCHTLLDTNEFSANQNGKNNRVVRRPSCKSCRVDIDGARINSKEKKSFSLIKPHLIKFTCPICTKTTIPGLTSRVVLDHDHSTGKVRGWICDSCNTGLGRFKDDITLLKRAISYLENK